MRDGSSLVEITRSRVLVTGGKEGSTYRRLHDGIHVTMSFRRVVGNRRLPVPSFLRRHGSNPVIPNGRRHPLQATSRRRDLPDYRPLLVMGDSASSPRMLVG